MGDGDAGAGVVEVVRLVGLGGRVAPIPGPGPQALLPRPAIKSISCPRPLRSLREALHHPKEGGML